jgi:CheY-like chemotaxis protein
MPTLLLIDDDERFLAEAEHCFNAAGYHVLPVPNGWRGLSAMHHHAGEISMALVNFDRLDTCGLMLLDRLRRGNPAIPIIATTATLPDHNHEIAHYLRVRAVLPKPLTPAWVETVAAATGRARVQTAASGAVGV